MHADTGRPAAICRDRTPPAPGGIDGRGSEEDEGNVRTRCGYHFGPASPVSDLDPLVKSLVERATQQRHAAQEDTERREMKQELIEFGLAEVRRRIDALAPRLVGTKGSLKRCHIQATLRDEFRATLRRELHGDEDWGEVRTHAEEFVAAWHVRQAPSSRIPKAATLIAGATGTIGGVVAAAALSPEIRARLAQLKAPLRIIAENLLTHISTPPPSAPPPTNPPEQATTPPPVFRPGVGVAAGSPRFYRPRSSYAPPGTRPSPRATPGGAHGAAPPRNAASSPTSPERPAYDQEGARDPAGGG